MKTTQLTLCLTLSLLLVLSIPLASAGLLSFLDSFKTLQPTDNVLTGNVIGSDRGSSFTLKEGESAAVPSRAFSGLTLTVTRITRPDTVPTIGSCADQNVEVVLSASSPSFSESYTLFRSQKPNEIKKASTSIKFGYAGLDLGGNKFATFSTIDNCKFLSLMSSSLVCGSNGNTYLTACDAEAAGALLFTEGACPNKCYKINDPCANHFSPMCMFKKSISEVTCDAQGCMVGPCTVCGNKGQPCCQPNDACNANQGLNCAFFGATGEKRCQSLPPCGSENQACCVQGRAENNVPSYSCKSDLLCQGGKCTPFCKQNTTSSNCGSENQTCCLPSNTCNAGLACSVGMCKQLRNGPPPEPLGNSVFNSGGVCGDGLCQKLVENVRNCPKDCKFNLGGMAFTRPTAECGDGLCQKLVENVRNCPSDCKFNIGGMVGAQPSSCGNGVCGESENADSCPVDCSRSRNLGGLASGTPPIQIGDVNKDGKINAGDATLIQQHLGGVRSFTNEQKRLADVNQNQQVDAGDAIIILEMDVGNRGDINGDDHIDVADAMLAGQYANGLRKLTPPQLFVADANADGSVTVNDANLIGEYIVGKVGDLNGDNAADAADAMLIGQYLNGLRKLSNIQLRMADVNKDGQVTQADADAILGITSNCGNGLCESSETPQNCYSDCGAICPSIAQRLCGEGQTSISGGSDEKGCPRGNVCCGDGQCETYAENANNCPKDCSGSAVVCKPGQVIGDLNGDGTISVSDRVLLTNILYGYSTPPSDVCCADLTKDNEVTIGDQVKMDRILSGLDRSPGVCGTPPAICGNKVCDTGETTQNCPSDCTFTTPKFKSVSWECYDKYKSKKSGDCKTVADWRRTAEESCKSHCRGDKCGVNTFNVYDECKPSTCGNGKCDESENTNSCPSDCGVKPSVCRVCDLTGDGSFTQADSDALADCIMGKRTVGCPSDVNGDGSLNVADVTFCIAKCG